MRPNRIGLKNHADLPLLRRDIAGRTGRKYGLAVENNIARIGLFQARDAAHQRGLARTAGPQKNEELPFLDFEIDAIQGRHCLLP